MHIKSLLLHPIIMYLTNIYQILAMMIFFPFSRLMTLLGIYNFSAMLIKILLLHPIIMYLTNIYQILAMMGFFPLFPLRLYYWNHLSRKYKTERYVHFFMDFIVTKQLRKGGINYSEGFFQLSREHFLSRTFLFR
jgi:hypothetical protein